MSEKIVRSCDENLIIEKYIGSMESATSYMVDPFDPTTIVAQVRSATLGNKVAEITAFQVDSNSLSPVMDVRIETLSDTSADLLRALGNLSPALANIKKTE